MRAAIAQEVLAVNLRAALHQCFEAEPFRIFTVKNLYEGIREY